jgi:hypothetical protein
MTAAYFFGQKAMTKFKALPLDYPVGTQGNKNLQSEYSVPRPRFEPAISLTHTCTTMFLSKPTCLVTKGLLNH